MDKSDPAEETPEKPETPQPPRGLLTYLKGTLTPPRGPPADGGAAAPEPGAIGAPLGDPPAAAPEPPPPGPAAPPPEPPGAHFILPQLRFSTADAAGAPESTAEHEQKQAHSHEQPPPPLYKRVLRNVGQYFYGPGPAELDPKAACERHGLVTVDALARVVIVGVHGWFPARWLQYVVGEPTGTSLKFCAMLDGALAAFLDTHFRPKDGQPRRIDVKTVALEGGGVVRQRVETLWTQLEAHRAAIELADWVLVATHSQGTPVSVLLLQRLLERGWIRPRPRCAAARARLALDGRKAFQRVGLLAMAGIGHGPFPAIRANMVVRYLEQDAARELFEFCDSSRVVTRLFRAALAQLLEAGVRIVAVGSWADQVVPLYSSALEHVRHPNLWRCLYVSAHDYRGPDDVLAGLLEAALLALNAGVRTRGVVQCLSEFAAGSMYSGTPGHSVVYEEAMVYDQFLHWVLWDEYASAGSRAGVRFVPCGPDPKPETGHRCANRVEPDAWNYSAESPNPFVLPARLAQLVGDAALAEHAPVVQARLHDALLRAHDWRPRDKERRELKRRLAGFSPSRL